MLWRFFQHCVLRYKSGRKWITNPKKCSRSWPISNYVAQELFPKRDIHVSILQAKLHAYERGLQVARGWLITVLTFSQLEKWKIEQTLMAFSYYNPNKVSSELFLQWRGKIYGIICLFVCLFNVIAVFWRSSYLATRTAHSVCMFPLHCIVLRGLNDSLLPRELFSYSAN